MQALKVKLEASQLPSEQEVEWLCQTAENILFQEPNVLELSAPQHVFGDIHGQFYDCLSMLASIPPEASLLFLGDYVDRGYHSVETVCYLLVLKCLRPQTVFLLRGNHETASLTRTYGFYDEVQRKYGNPRVWQALIDLFSSLPLAAVVDSKYLCLHGGLSPSLPLLEAFTAIPRQGDIPENGPMCDLVWSDPDPAAGRGWSLNSRGAGYLFSVEVVRQFLELNGLEMLVRAHQLAEEGHCFNFGGQGCFVTVWSAPNYCYRCGNLASVMKIGPGGYGFVDFGAAPESSGKKVHFDNLLPYFL